MSAIARTGKTLVDRFKGSLKKYNWLGLVFSVVGMVLCFVFVLPAVLTNNPLYGFNYISERPVQVVVYYRGETAVFEPGSAEYDQVLAASHQALYTANGFNEIGWSGARFAQARAEGIAVELIYAEPVKLPGSRLTFADPTRLFFPLEVFGHEGEVIFRGRAERYWGAPIRVDSLDPVREAVAALFEGD